MRLFFIIFILVLIFSCNESKEKLIPENYQKWPSSTTEILNYSIPGHGNRLREIHMNEKALAAKIVNGKAEFPEGAVIVKDVYASNEKKSGELPIQATVMIKAPNDPRSRSGWLWVVKDLTTNSETVLQGEFCFTCHNNANESHPYADGNPKNEFHDFVFIFPNSVNTGGENKPKDSSSPPNYGYNY